MHRAERHGVAQAGRALVGRDAHPLIALAHVQLRALAVSALSRCEHRRGPARPARAPRPPPRPSRRGGRRAGSGRPDRGRRARAARARPRAGARSGARGRSPARGRPACTGRGARSRRGCRTARSSVCTPRSRTLRYTVHVLILSSHLVRQEHSDGRHAAARPSRRRCGTATSCTRPPASPTCSTSTCTSCTR